LWIHIGNNSFNIEYPSEIKYGSCGLTEFLSIILCTCSNARPKFNSLSVVIVFVFWLIYVLTLQDFISDVYSPIQDFGQVWSNAHGSHQYMCLVRKYCYGDSTGSSEVDTEKHTRRQLVKKQWVQKHWQIQLSSNQ
jgi:hypothetical protein